MVSASDILAILEKIPLWKTLTTLPGRVRELEQRIERLENEDNTSTSGRRCKICNSANLTHLGTEDDKVFGDLGLKVATFQCNDCGEITEIEIKRGGM